MDDETENSASGRIRADRDDRTSALPASIMNTDRSPSTPLSSFLSLTDQLVQKKREELGRQMAKKKPENLNTTLRNTARQSRWTQPHKQRQILKQKPSSRLCTCPPSFSVFLPVFVLSRPLCLHSFLSCAPCLPCCITFSFQARVPKPKPQQFLGKGRVNIRVSERGTD